MRAYSKCTPFKEDRIIEHKQRELVINQIPDIQISKGAIRQPLVNRAAIHVIKREPVQEGERHVLIGMGMRGTCQGSKSKPQPQVQVSSSIQPQPKQKPILQPQMPFIPREEIRQSQHKFIPHEESKVQTIILDQSDERMDDQPKVVPRKRIFNPFSSGMSSQANTYRLPSNPQQESIILDRDITQNMSQSDFRIYRLPLNQPRQI